MYLFLLLLSSLPSITAHAQLFNTTTGVRLHSGLPTFDADNALRRTSGTCQNLIRRR